eukprot:12086943-Alexandrium_andersonii.AAC.1
MGLKHALAPVWAGRQHENRFNIFFRLALARDSDTELVYNQPWCLGGSGKPGLAASWCPTPRGLA